MRKSVFLHDLEKRYRDIDTEGVRARAEVAEQMYSKTASSASFLQSLMYTIIGATSFLGCGYLIFRDAYNYEVGMDGLAPLFIGAVLFEIVAWLAKGLAARSVWNFTIDDDWKDTTIFLQIEGSSYLIYVVALIAYYLVSMVSSNFAGLIFGFFILLRQYILYSLYKNNLEQSVAKDRIILILVNLAVYTVLLSFPYLMIS